MNLRAAICRAPALACALALAVVAGCGGDGQTTTNAPPITKAAYVRKADAVCQRAYDQIKLRFEAFTEGKATPFSTPEEVSEYAETVIVPVRKQQLEEMRALGAPKGDEESVEAILAAYEDGIGRAEEDPEEAVSSAFGVFGEAEELTRDYGLKNCR